VNRDKPKAYIGIGAFNLVRKAMYQKCGGYEALRLTVVDDVKLGLLVRRAGGKTRAFLGAENVKCHWGSTVGHMIKIMEKNYFAAVDFRLGLVIAGSFVALLLLGLIGWGLASGTVIGLTAGLSPLLLTLPGATLARRLEWPRVCALYVPFMLPVFLYALLNSTYRTVAQGGIRWRDTFYPLAELRAGNVK
jgi:hypothetical protein